MTTITKEQISVKIAEELSIVPDTARSYLDSLLDIMKSTLAQDRDVMITGFGKFSVRRKRPRFGRNPKTGEVLELRGRRVVTFKLSGILRKKLTEDSRTAPSPPPSQE
jgi:integration host factor subunit alpha